MDDDDLVVGPNGLPLVDAERDVLHAEYTAWQEQNPGISMSISDYAARFFFVECSPHDSVASDDNTDASKGEGGADASARGRSLYPDLSRQSAPANIEMSSAHTQRRALPVLNRADIASLPVLTRISGMGEPARTVKTPLVAGATKRAIPVLERIPIDARVFNTPTTMPTLESIPVVAKHMPALERMPSASRVDGGARMPALERIPSASRVDGGARMPALERIPSASRVGGAHLPTLERVDHGDDALAMSAVGIRATMDSVRGHGMDALFRPRSIPVHTGASATLKAGRRESIADILFDDDSNDDSQDLGGGTRAALVHSFCTIRDSFAKDKVGIASDVGASRGALLSFAAELRDALAVVEVGDAHRASLVRSRHLSQNALAAAARAPESDPGRAAFVTSAATLASVIVDAHDSDAKMRAILVGIQKPLVGIKKPIMLVNSMNEAWKRLVNRIIKSALRDVLPATIIGQTFTYFGPIASAVTTVSPKTAPSALEARIMVWSSMAEAITMTSLASVLTKAAEKDIAEIAEKWTTALDSEVYAFMGMGADESPTACAIGGGLRTERKLEGKIKKGLNIIVNKGLAAPVGSRMTVANFETTGFITKYLQGKDIAKSTGRELLVRAFVSTMCGIALMRDVERNINNNQALESMRTKYVVQPMKNAYTFLQARHVDVLVEE